MDSAVYDNLNKVWKSTCRILLRDEVGELSEYKDWLYNGNGPRLIKKSIVSGKDVAYSNDQYPEGSKWIRQDEILNKPEPLSIDEIKDIDSIIEAVKERIFYAGNIVLGNSKFVDESTTINDCFYVLHSERVASSKNVAYSSRGGYSENIFGCYGFGPVFFSIKSGGIADSTRIFMTSKADFSSDIYYSHGISNCSECMFSFNLRSKRYAIGNLTLPKDKYAEIKKKLLEEITYDLRKNKSLPSIAGLVKQAKPDNSYLNPIKITMPSTKKETSDKKKIQDAFAQTSSIVLGKKLENLDDYADWMKNSSRIKLIKAKSCLSGNQVILPDYAGFMDYPTDRLLTQDEAYLAGENLSISEEETSKLSLENAPIILQKIAYFCPIWLAGKLKNNIDSPLNIDSINCYAGVLYIRSKSCAFSFSPRSCEYCFGSREGRYAFFSINSYFSTRINRCFEVDHCSDCNDCYFCHNCENLNNCMFCFNAKSLRYAIGNTPVDKQIYEETKTKLKSWLIEKLEQKKEVDSNIFSL